MNRYFFILGKNPTISLAEIIAVLDKQKTRFSIKYFSREILILETAQLLDAPLLNKTLGGTVKIGQIKDSVGLDEEEEKFEEIFSANNLLDKYFPKGSRKLRFGISIYTAGGHSQYVAQLEKKTRDLNATIKQNLSEKGIKSGFLRLNERSLSSVSVFKNKLLTEGAEIIIVICENEIMIGKTLVVQEFANFSFRDYSRPARDKRSGIMPPKLARIMINLSQLDKEAVLLDPFCGSGTILTEAIILGYKDLTGSDLSRKAIRDTNTNIEWLFQNYRSLNRDNFRIKTFEQDVATILRRIPESSIGATVTEPYLGPPLYRSPDKKTVEGIFSQIKNLYISAFKQLSHILEPNGKVVIIFPAYRINSEWYFFDLIGDIKQLGFIQLDPLPSNMLNNIAVDLSVRKTLLYADERHFVQREILIFQKK